MGFEVFHIILGKGPRPLNSEGHLHSMCSLLLPVHLLPHPTNRPCPRRPGPPLALLTRAISEPSGSGACGDLAGCCGPFLPPLVAPWRREHGPWLNVLRVTETEFLLTLAMLVCNITTDGILLMGKLRIRK